jgi:putative ABC transport system permease protein
VTGWLAALRIARREARRAKGRSALVIALIGLPVLGLGFAAATYDMFRLTPQERVPREIGAADAELRWEYAGPVEQEDARGEILRYSPDDPEVPPVEQRRTAPEVGALLPPGSTVTPRYQGLVRLETATGTARIDWHAFDLADPLTFGLARITQGRAPDGAGEAALTATAAQRLGVEVGGRVDTGRRGYTLVGMVQFPGVPGAFDTFRTPGLTHEVALFHPAGLPGDEWSVRWLVDTPRPVSWDQVQELNQHGVVAYSRTVVLDPPPDLSGSSATSVGEGTFRTGVVVAGLAGLEIVLLAGPAFAVGARRRQRDLALVAVAGGTPAHQRRIVLADGVVLGLAAAALGVLLGLGAALVARPVVAQHLFGGLPGGYRVYPLAVLGIVGFAVVTGLLAALVPAFTAARQDVVGALAGRRGSRGFRRRWLVTGLALTGLGAVVTGYGAWQVAAEVVLAGLVLAQLGLALCVPALIGLVARLGSRLPLAPRISLRDTARNRSAAAPAISAVMAAVAGAVTVGVAMVSFQAQDAAAVPSDYPPGTVSAGVQDRYDPTSPATVAAVERAARRTLPVAETHRLLAPWCPDLGSECLAVAVVPEEKRCPYLIWDEQDPYFGGGGVPAELSPAEQRVAARDPRCDRIHPVIGFGTVFDDGFALAALTGAGEAAVDRAAAVLRGGGAVVTDERFLDDRGQVILLVMAGEPGDATEITVPGLLLEDGHERHGAIVSAAALRSAGLDAVPAQPLFTTTRMPTQAEEDAFVAAMEQLGTWGAVHREFTGRGSPVVALLALAAGLIAVGAAGIATGLAAADRRADLSTLGVVGAAGRIRRAMSLNQSGVIAGLGTVLGLVAGLGASVAVLSAMNQRYAGVWPAPPPIPITVPWPYLAGLLAVPVIAMAGAGLLTRSRLPVERRTG